MAKLKQLFGKLIDGPEQRRFALSLSTNRSLDVLFTMSFNLRDQIFSHCTGRFEASSLT